MTEKGLTVRQVGVGHARIRGCIVPTHVLDNIRPIIAEVGAIPTALTKLLMSQLLQFDRIYADTSHGQPKVLTFASQVQETSYLC